MPLFNSQQNDRGIRWQGIAATVVVELLVLLALSGGSLCGMVIGRRSSRIYARDQAIGV